MHHLFREEVKEEKAKYYRAAATAELFCYRWQRDAWGVRRRLLLPKDGSRAAHRLEDDGSLVKGVSHLKNSRRTARKGQGFSQRQHG